MVTPRYKWDGLILAHIIAEEFNKRSPHLAIKIESVRVACLQILPVYKIYQDYKMNLLSQHE
jgi:hypothetical protein